MEAQSKALSEIAEIIIEHYTRYPKIQLPDLFKLLYQNEFGCEHLVADAAGTLDYLQREWENVTASESEPLFENVGNGFGRLNLAAAKLRCLAPGAINKLFVLSAQQSAGSREGYRAKLDVVGRLCQDGVLPFGYDDFASLLRQAEERGYPAQHHSSFYREHYHPAYRVVRADLLYLLPLLERIDTLLETKPTLCLAIDGRCAAGKSTMTALLASVYDAGVVHMDDFFLPLDLRTEKRLAEPGGNVHYERFLSEVAPGLRGRRAFQYQRFDCTMFDYQGEVEVPAARLFIVEGAYCLRPELRDLYDLKVFLSISVEEQLQRLRQRCGEGSERLRLFEERWIPLEERYITFYDVPDNCDFILSNSR